MKQYKLTLFYVNVIIVPYVLYLIIPYPSIRKHIIQKLVIQNVGSPKDLGVTSQGKLLDYCSARWTYRVLRGHQNRTSINSPSHNCSYQKTGHWLSILLLLPPLSPLNSPLPSTLLTPSAVHTPEYRLPPPSHRH